MLDTIIAPTNRYAQLLTLLPDGRFYRADGAVLPHRDTPYEFLVQTGVIDQKDTGGTAASGPGANQVTLTGGTFASTLLGDYFVSGAVVATVVSVDSSTQVTLDQDVSFSASAWKTVRPRLFRIFRQGALLTQASTLADGSLVFRAQLPQGDSDLQVVDTVTSAGFRYPLTLRATAAWHAAYADVFGALDTTIRDVAKGQYLVASDDAQAVAATAEYLAAPHGLMLRQPNDIIASTEAYRLTLQELRQSYRLFGGLSRGVEQAIGAFTGAGALRVPRAWRPLWTLGASLCPNGSFDARAREVDAMFLDAGLDLPNINAKSRTYVVTSFAENAANTYAGTIVQPPYPQRLTVTFPTGWQGGAITVYGLDVHGSVIADVFAVPGVLPGTVSGVLVFASVTGVVKATSAGAGDVASVGVADYRFVRFTALTARFPLAAASLDYDATAKTLDVSSGAGTPVDVSVSGTYTLPTTPTAPSYVGTTVATFDLSDGAERARYDRLYLTIDGRQELVVVITPVAAIAAVTALEVKTAINAACAAAPGYTDLVASIVTDAAGSAIQLYRAVADLGSTVTLRVRRDVADAAHLVLGLPFDTRGLSAGAAAAATSLSATLAWTYLPGATARDSYQARVGRGVRTTGTSWEIASVRGTHAKFICNDGGFASQTIDLGGAIRVYSAVNGANLGVHRIDEVTGGTEYRVTNGNGVAFVAEVNAAAAYAVYSPGEVVTVVDVTGGTITLASGLAYAKASGSLVEVEDELPLLLRGTDGLASATVTVNRDAALVPAGTPSDAFTPEGTDVPDGWQVTHATAAYVAPGRFQPEVLVLTRVGANTMTLSRSCPEVLEAKGLNVSVRFWVQQHFTASASINVTVDFGSGGTSTLTTTVARTVYGARNPTVAYVITEVPWNATQCLITLSSAAGANGNRISIEQVRVQIDTSTGLCVGTNTVPRSRHRSAFGGLYYLWAGVELSAAASRGVGLPAYVAPPTTRRSDNEGVEGAIDRAASAHTFNERVDVSEYVADGQAVNIRGAYSDLEWPAATLVNLEVVVASPPNRSYVRPTRISKQSETLVFAAPPDAVLTYTSTQRGATIPNGRARLLELAQGATAAVPLPDGGDLVDDWSRDVTLLLPAGSTAARGPAANQVTLTNGTFDGVLAGDVFRLDAASAALAATASVIASVDSSTQITVADDLPVFSDEYWAVVRLAWSFLADDTITVPSYTASSTWSFDYDVLVQAETAAIDLSDAARLPGGGDYKDYRWFIDLYAYRRQEALIVTYRRTEQVTFTAAGVAALQRPSDQDAMSAVLTADDGRTKTLVPQARWSFVDGQTIRIDTALFDANVIYTFEYNAEAPMPEAPVTMLIEHRHGASAKTLAAATYATVAVGDLVTPDDAYHQVRVTLYDIVDVRDVRLFGLGLRGVHLYGVYGATPYAPGVVR